MEVHRVTRKYAPSCSPPGGPRMMEGGLLLGEEGRVIKQAEKVGGPGSEFA